LEFYIMTTVTLYGVDVPETIQTKMAQTIASSEKNEKAWQVLGQDMLKLGLTAEMIRRPYGEDKQSHKQLSALIIAGLPAAMQTAMAKPPAARSAKDKDLAETGQKRVGVYTEFELPTTWDRIAIALARVEHNKLRRPLTKFLDTYLVQSMPYRLRTFQVYLTAID
jgi:hypothetical protein